MDIAPLVTELTQLLGPYLPLLLKVGDKATDAVLENAIENLGKGAWKKAKGTLGKLGGKVKKKEAAKEALEDLGKRSEDPRRLGAAELQLEKVLEEDPGLAEELAKLLAALGPREKVEARDEAVVATHGGVASRYVAVGGNVEGGVHVNVREASGPDEASLRKAYLHKLMEQSGYLSLSGVDPALAGNDRDARLRLEAVYTALLTLSWGERVGRMEEMALPRDEGRLSALTQLNRHDRLVLLGEPGGGKTTFVNFLALSMAGEILGRSDANLRVLTSPLPNSEDRGKKRREPWKYGPLLPVRVVLRDFAARGLPKKGKAAAEDLWNFIEAELRRDGLPDYFPILRSELLSSGGLILLDGLDEVPEAEKRREQIRQAVEGFVQGLGRCRVLVTSRTYAYRNQGWSLNGFAEAELAPFTDGQIRSFVHRWYGHVAPLRNLTAEVAENRAGRLVDAIFGNDRLEELAHRPLLLTLMASLHAWRGGDLPEGREELYSGALDLLLHLWESQRESFDEEGRPVCQPSLTEFLAVGKDKVRKALESLAFEVHAANPEGARTADIPEARLVSLLLDLSQGGDRDLKLLRDYLRERTGLLEARGEGVYGFPHRTFQEYLAACHLTRESFPYQIADLARQDPLRWREVVLLAGARAPNVWSLVYSLCWQEPESSKELADAWGAQLAGQVVVASAQLAEIAEQNRPNLERVRRWLVHLLGDGRFPAVERALAGDNLARLGDPRREVMTVDRMEFRKISAGKFLMGGEDGPIREVDIPYTYRMARFPVTVAQFREFVMAEGIERPQDWDEWDNRPVTMVSWHEATAFCEWLTRRRGEDGWVVRLPSEEEWEKAARGTDGRVYPWEGDFDPERASSREAGIDHPSAVGCFPAGESPYHCEEMSGNVWEWSRSLFDNDGELRVLRGGSFFDLSGNVRCAVRDGLDPVYRNDSLGFRVALLPFSSDL